MSLDWVNLYSLLQIALYFMVLLGFAWPLGEYICHVFTGKRTTLTAMFTPLERVIYRLGAIRPEEGMHWKRYAASVLGFSLVNILFLYTLLRVQHWLPMNPEGLPNVPAHLAFNIAVSFVTNTNWQSYAGETTLSAFSQMVGLAVQNFISAAVGLAVLVATVRGFIVRNAETLGNFWADLVRGILYVLLPLSLLLSVLLVGQGVPQSFDASYEAQQVDTASTQHIPLGPVASQVAIKQLGSNGGGYFNANSAHPFENPTAFSNFLEMIALLLVPAALCITFGCMVGDRRQGLALLAAMLLLLVPMIFACISAEQKGNPLLVNVDQSASAQQNGGNMEGKEARFGIVQSAMWAALTTASSNGSVTSALDSYTPLGGFVPMVLIQYGEVVFGGVGSGLYGMLVFVLLTVFVAGLMVGRTPEYLGKKIQAFEIKMVSVAILLPPFFVLMLTAVACHLPMGQVGILNPGPQGFSEILYAFTSAANNNGSAFGGLSANTPFYNTLLGIAMLFGRFGIVLPVLAIAGSLAKKNIVPRSPGTLPTHGPLFILMLAMFCVVVSVLTYVPALALGPLAAHLQLHP